VTSREERERGSREGPPQRFGETTPPGLQADYSVFTVQTVLEMQRTLGGIETAIKNLEERSKEHSGKLDQIGKEVYAAKVVVGVVGGLIVLAGAFIGWVIYELLPYFVSHPVPPIK
jgi:hypothetical protein